jgi:LPXTG-motif cell wall-anchored protein
MGLWHIMASKTESRRFRMGTWRAGLALLVGSVLFLGIGLAPAYAQQEVRVGLTEYTITPNPITVRAGERVRFTASNTGARPHDLHIEGQGVAFEVVSDPGVHIPAGQTATAEFTFNAVGTYQMWCPVGDHREQGMEGNFVVVAAGAAAPPTRPAPAPAQAPRQLPRTGDPGIALTFGALAAAGAGLASLGLIIRRRK